MIAPCHALLAQIAEPSGSSEGLTFAWKLAAVMISVGMVGVLMLVTDTSFPDDDPFPRCPSERNPPPPGESVDERYRRRSHPDE